MAICTNCSQGVWPWEGTIWARELAPGIWDYSGGGIGGEERESQKEHPQLLHNLPRDSPRDTLKFGHKRRPSHKP